MRIGEEMREGVCQLEIAICDIKFQLGRPTTSPLCLYRERCGCVVECAEQPESNSSQYRDYESPSGYEWFLSLTLGGWAKRVRMAAVRKANAAVRKASR